jgi:FkbM family methyltransferase
MTADEENLKWIKKYVAMGDVLVDVGAHHGDYTEHFLDILGLTGRIYAVEMNQSNYQHTRDRFANRPNVAVIHAAVTNVDGPVMTYEGDNSYTGNIIGHNTSFVKRPEAGNVDGITLDTLLAGEKLISLIKIDVEGAELQALQGLAQTIHRVKYILLECHFDEDWPQIRELLLQTYGLKCFCTHSGEQITMDSRRHYQCFCTTL